MKSLHGGKRSTVRSPPITPIVRSKLLFPNSSCLLSSFSLQQNNNKQLILLKF